MTFDARALFLGTPTSTPKVAWAHIDDQGHLVLPPQVAAQLGLVAGSQVRLEPGRNGLRSAPTGDTPGQALHRADQRLQPGLRDLFPPRLG